MPFFLYLLQHFFFGDTQAAEQILLHTDSLEKEIIGVLSV
jgi:hypothetical protein